MSNKTTQAVRSLAKGLLSKDKTIVPKDLLKTYNALVKAGVTSISEDDIFTIAEDKLADFMKEIDDDLVLEKLPQVKSMNQTLPAKGMCNVLIRHDGSDALFDKDALKVDKGLSAAVSAIMRRRS